jgi:hypothetical protein
MRLLRSSLPLLVTTVITVVALAAPASTTRAFDLRSPQIPFCSGPLQGYFAGIGQGINVTTDQLDAQKWTSSLSGNAAFTIMLEQTRDDAFTLGVYNIDDPSNPPSLFQVFPIWAGVNWSAYVQFGGGNLTVNLFNAAMQFQGQTVYNGVSATRFGFYLQGILGTFYSQDSRNGGRAQILTYAGTGRSWGDWWECFEDQPYHYPDPGCASDFNDAVLELQSVTPVAVHGQTWGALKSLYR